MLSCPAEGCTFRAKTDRALTTHIGKCKKAAAGLASIAEEIEQHEAEGHRQPKRRRILSPEHPEVMVDVEETAYVDCEVRTMNIDMKPDILFRCQSLIRMKINCGITHLCQTYLYPLSMHPL
jgi:hypothetical protein